MALQRLIAVSIVVGMTWNAMARQSIPMDGLENVEVLSGLADPSMIVFSPDGRMFISERIEGRLRVARFNQASDQWELNSEPFYTFDVPADGFGNPAQYRSCGLRGVAFDPNFEQNGFVYCFFMKNQPRHNRVVRIRASDLNPDVADVGETLLLDIPFHSSMSSGSHNGGALAFGADGMLYITTGDGWVDGDNVQSLSTFTGKVLRIRSDGTIPEDNPFYDQASDNFRSIYALGLRNPFTVAIDPFSDNMYINDVGGANKASVLLLAPGANYGHDGFGGIGIETAAWGNGNTGSAAGNVITGGAWIPNCGPFPPAIRGGYVTSLWGTNSQDVGSLTHIPASGGTADSVLLAESGVSDPAGDLKPISVVLGPDGWLYYLVSSYEAENGRVFALRPVESGSPDVNGDGSVSVSDLLLVLNAWGPCASENTCPEDIVGDCEVDIQDLLEVLSQWG